MQEVTDANFADTLGATDKLVIVDFWAPWCGPCRMLSPVLEKVSHEYQELTVLKMNVDENPDIPSQIGVRALPTLVAFLNGSVIGHEVGALSQEKLRSWMQDLLKKAKDTK